MTKYLFNALLYFLIGSVGWALYLTVLAWTEWRIIAFVISFMGTAGGFSLLMVYLLHLLRIVK